MKRVRRKEEDKSEASGEIPLASVKEKCKYLTEKLEQEQSFKLKPSKTKILCQTRELTTKQKHPKTNNKVP